MRKKYFFKAEVREALPQRNSWKAKYEICGLVAACTAEHLLKHPTCHGVSWACEILDPDKVLAICLETGAISDFRTVSLDINEEAQGQSFVPQLEDGEIA
jgi:hypothetical protein